MAGLDFLRFQLTHFWRQGPLAAASLFCALLCCLCASALLAFWTSRSQTLGAELTHLRDSVPVARPIVPKPLIGNDLPFFHSAEFTAQFLSIARDVGVPTDEISYALESSAVQPYLRYRVSLDTKSGYPEVRKLLAALSAEQPHVSLDSIRCRRDDAGSANLNCQLEFSAFFRKVLRG